MDPENQTAYRFQEGSLLRTKFASLPLEQREIPFSSEQLFAELGREIDESVSAPAP